MSDVNDDPNLVQYQDHNSGQVMLIPLNDARMAVATGAGKILTTMSTVQMVSPYQAYRQNAVYSRVYSSLLTSSLEAALTKLNNDLGQGKATSADLVATLLTAYGQGKITLSKLGPIIKAP